MLRDCIARNRVISIHLVTSSTTWWRATHFWQRTLNATTGQRCFLSTSSRSLFWLGIATASNRTASASFDTLLGQQSIHQALFGGSWGAIRNNWFVVNKCEMMNAKSTCHWISLLGWFNGNVPRLYTSSRHDIILTILLMQGHHFVAEFIECLQAIERNDRALINPTTFVFIAEEPNMILYQTSLAS